MYAERLQHLENMESQLTAMLEEATRQDAVEAIAECKRQLKQIENEIKRLNSNS